MRLLDLPLVGSISVRDLVLEYLKTRYDYRQVLGVDTLVHHEQVACEFVEPNAQVPALFCDALNGLGSKRLLALNWDLLLFLSIHKDYDRTIIDISPHASEIFESDVCVMGVFVDDAER